MRHFLPSGMSEEPGGWLDALLGGQANLHFGNPAAQFWRDAVAGELSPRVRACAVVLCGVHCALCAVCCTQFGCAAVAGRGAHPEGALCCAMHCVVIVLCDTRACTAVVPCNVHGCASDSAQRIPHPEEVKAAALCSLLALLRFLLAVKACLPWLLS